MQIFNPKQARSLFFLCLDCQGMILLDYNTLASSDSTLLIVHENSCGLAPNSLIGPEAHFAMHGGDGHYPSLSKNSSESNMISKQELYYIYYILYYFYVSGEQKDLR